jgi:hypothetical protein
MFIVVVNKAAKKGVAKMPTSEQDLFMLLTKELGSITHHCHPSRKWVACWRHENDTIEIEVYYAGSRESAPY